MAQQYLQDEEDVFDDGEVDFGVAHAAQHSLQYNELESGTIRRSWPR